MVSNQDNLRSKSVQFRLFKKTNNKNDYKNCDEVVAVSQASNACYKNFKYNELELCCTNPKLTYFSNF